MSRRYGPRPPRAASYASGRRHSRRKTSWTTSWAAVASPSTAIAVRWTVPACGRRRGRTGGIPQVVSRKRAHLRSFKSVETCVFKVCQGLSAALRFPIVDDVTATPVTRGLRARGSADRRAEPPTWACPRRPARLGAPLRCAAPVRTPSGQRLYSPPTRRGCGGCSTTCARASRPSWRRDSATIRRPAGAVPPDGLEPLAAGLRARSRLRRRRRTARARPPRSPATRSTASCATPCSPSWRPRRPLGAPRAHRRPGALRLARSSAGGCTGSPAAGTPATARARCSPARPASATTSACCASGSRCASAAGASVYLGPTRRSPRSSRRPALAPPLVVLGAVANGPLLDARRRCGLAGPPSACARAGAEPPTRWRAGCAATSARRPDRRRRPGFGAFRRVAFRLGADRPPDAIDGVESQLDRAHRRAAARAARQESGRRVPPGARRDARAARGRCRDAGAQAERNVEVEATDRAALLAEWLAELVFLAEMEGLVPESVRDLVVAEDSVTGIVRGPPRRAPPSDQGRDLPRPRAQTRPRRLARERRPRRLARPEAPRALQTSIARSTLGRHDARARAPPTGARAAPARPPTRFARRVRCGRRGWPCARRAARPGRRSHADHSSLRSSAASRPGRAPPAAG